MRLLISSLLLSSIFAFTNGLRCYSCTNAKRNSECRRTVTCSWGALGCENVIRLQNNQIIISKHCQQYSACKANLKNNFGQCIPKTLLKASRDDVDLQPTAATSFCRTCCNKDLCNRRVYMEESVTETSDRGFSRHRQLLPPVADVEATLTSPTTALITFTDPSDDPGAVYYITVQPSKGVEITAVKANQISTVDFNDTLPRNVIAYVASGLSSGTRYKIDIVKKVGFSRYHQGTFDGFVTRPKPLRDIKVVEYNTDSVLLRLVNSPKNGNYDTIRMAYRKTSDPESSEKTLPSSSRPGLVRISDLEPSTEYIISTWTSLDGGPRIPDLFSDRVNVTVFTKIPPVVDIVLQDHHAMNLTWLFKTSYEGYRRYQKNFVITVRDDTDGRFVAEEILHGAKRSFTSKDLVPEHYYSFTVKAMTDGRYSEVVRHAPVRTLTRCYGCLDAKSAAECMGIIECLPDDRGCLVELRSRSFGHSKLSSKSFRASMKCKQVNACDKQEDQNLSMQCDPAGRKRNTNPPEVCRCCCEGDLCDGPGTDCGKLLGWLDPLRDPPPTQYPITVLCPRLKAPRGGTISCTGEGQNVLGTKCTFTCPSATYLLGISETECLEGGTWSHRIPQCIRAKRCPSIETTDRLYARCTRFNRPFSRCEISCRPGYIRYGSAITTCKPDGHWTRTQARCVEQDECRPNPCVNLGHCVDLINDFDCECRPGYYGELCERERVCALLEAPEYGTIECTDSNKFGSRCRYSCQPGYSMHGVRYTRCSEAGVWSGGDPTRCVVNKCEVIPQILINGGRSVCTGYSFGDTCRFTCPKGLRIAGGESEIVCQNNEEWSGELPCCDLPCPPYAKVDLILVLDSSSSVGKASWKELIKFTVALLDKFVIGDKDMRVGVLRYNRKVDASSEIDMGDYANSNHLKNKIRKIPYNGYGTKTGRALQHVFDHSIKVKGNRPGVPDVIVVITDGLASDNVKPPSQALRELGAKIYVVGVINKRNIVNVRQLQEMASGPRYLQIIEEGYAQLLSKLSEQLINDVCWLPCKFKYEQKELIDRRRQHEAARIEREEESYWELFDKKLRFNNTNINFPAVGAKSSFPRSAPKQRKSKTGKTKKGGRSDGKKRIVRKKSVPQ